MVHAQCTGRTAFSAHKHPKSDSHHCTEREVRVVRGRQESTSTDFPRRTDVKRRSLFSRNGEASASSLPLSSGVGRPRWVGYQISLCACVCASNHSSKTEVQSWKLTDEFSIVDGSLSLSRVSLPRRYNLLLFSALCHTLLSTLFASRDLLRDFYFIHRDRWRTTRRKLCNATCCARRLIRGVGLIERA